MDHTFTHKLSMEDGKSKYSFGVPITKQLLNATKLIHFPHQPLYFRLISRNLSCKIAKWNKRKFEFISVTPHDQL